jgi:hypothetical protein
MIYAENIWLTAGTWGKKKESRRDKRNCIKKGKEGRKER